MSDICPYCQGEDFVNDQRTISCAFCGHVLFDDNLVEDVQFSKGPGGQSRLQGAFVRSCQNESASMAKSIRRGEDQISMLIISMKIDDSIEHHANTFYKIAAQRGFTRRYKIDHVAAACLYVACRVKYKPYLLIDFSEKLAVNVYILGAVFLQLCQLLVLEEHPTIQKPVDPSLFIHKFTEALVAKMDENSVPRKEVVSAISKMALRIIASMKRDWMQTGRKPSGLCGAAIYVAALSNGIRFSKSEVITVVHICEATLTKRLIEFENTESGSLTIDEFNQRAEDLEREQLDVCTNKTGEADLLCEHKGNKVPPHVHAHGLCKECYDEFIQLSGGLNGGADPPSFQRPESEEAGQNISEKINDLSTENSHQVNTLGENVYTLESRETLGEDHRAAEEPAVPPFDYNNKESEDLDDIDDKEINCYLNNEQEARCKEIVWKHLNKEYLEEQAMKEAAKAASYSDMADATDEVRDAHKLAEAVSAAVANARKQKRRQKAMDAKNAGPPRNASEAASRILTKKRLNSKFNFDVLPQLFNEDNADLPSKKSRMAPEDGIGAEGVDATEEHEEGGNINSYDELDQDYQAHEVYEPDSYYNNDHDTGDYYEKNESYNYDDGNDTGYYL